MTNKEVVQKLGLKKGDKIKLIKISSHPELSGRSGTIFAITYDYQLQGNWGSWFIVPSIDEIEKISD